MVVKHTVIFAERIFGHVQRKPVDNGDVRRHIDSVHIVKGTACSLLHVRSRFSREEHGFERHDRMERSAAEKSEIFWKDDGFKRRRSIKRACFNPFETLRAKFFYIRIITENIFRNSF